MLLKKFRYSVETEHNRTSLPPPSTHKHKHTHSHKQTDSEEQIVYSTCISSLFIYFSPRNSFGRNQKAWCGNLHLVIAFDSPVVLFLITPQSNMSFVTQCTFEKNRSKRRSFSSNDIWTWYLPYLIYFLPGYQHSSRRNFFRSFTDTKN